MKLSFKSDIREATRHLTDIQRKQLPFATAKALTHTAQKAKTLMVQELRSNIDRPTPQTLNSLDVVRAEKKDFPDCFAVVDFKDLIGPGLTKTQALNRRTRTGSFFASGIPASKYLAPLFLGGDRSNKRFEEALRRKGILPVGLQTVPARGVPLNQYGNLPANIYAAILSGISASSDPHQNVTAASAKRGKRRSRQQFFVVRKAGTPIGIAARSRNGLLMIIAFVRPARYRKRLDFQRVQTETVRKELGREFKRALEHALATAKKR